MDKSKSERLKEILSNKLTNEDIEKRLKVEAQSIKKDSIQENQIEKTDTLEEKKENEIKDKEVDENLKEEKEEYEEKEDVVIPSIRDEEVEHKESNLLLYIVSIIAIFLVILTIYLFTKNDSTINEKSFETKEAQTTQIEKETKVETPKIKEIVKTEILKSLEIEKTTQEEKDKAVITPNKTEEIKEVETTQELPKEVETTKKETTENIEVLEEEPVKEVLEDIEKEEKKALKEEVKTEEPKEKIIIKEKIVTKVVPLDRKNFKEYYNSSKFNTLKCYNFKAGNVLPDAQCKKDLKKFLKDNEDAIRFQVIPVISEDDNTIFNKIKPNLSGMEQSFQDRVKEYMFRGLGRERVLETTWQIKNIMGNDVILTPTNYYVESKKNNKGVIIKAYH